MLKRSIQIAICDDEKIIGADTKQVAKEILAQRNSANTQVTVYTNGFDLLASKKSYDILLLDIEMPNMDGFQVAEAMRAKGENPLIIFLTSYPDYVFDSFKLQPFRYLLKPLNKADFQEAIDGALAELFTLQDVKTVTVMEAGLERDVKITDIFYVESLKRGAIICTEKENYFVSQRFSHLKAALSADAFVLVHNQYLVNLQHIREFNAERTVVILENGQEIAIARRRKKIVLKKYNEYVRQKLKR